MSSKKGSSRRKKRAPKTSVVNANEAASGGGDIPLVQDDRFASQHWDPRFGRLPPRVSGGATVDDERFRFKDADSKASRVDRFGRVKRTRTRPADSSSSESEADEGDAGGYLGISSSDSESADSGGEEDVGPPTQYGRATRRLAVQGLDWSATRAVDIFACFASFGASGLRRVAVYPSKLGLERLVAEERLGPQFIRPEERRMLSKSRSMLNNENADSEGAIPANVDAQVENDVDEGDESDDGQVGLVGVRDSERQKWRTQEAMRKYEEERLRYYYAVAEFSGPQEADSIYEQCDGVEYGESRCEFSLSFVPEDMVIDTVARDVCDKLPDGYTPPETAPNTLSNTTVASTWDADAPDRLVLKKKVMRRKEADEDNLRAYIHSSSESEVDKEDIERKRRLLLGGDDQGNDDGDGNHDGLVVTFDPQMLENEKVSDAGDADDGGLTASFDPQALHENTDGEGDEEDQGMIVSFDPDEQEEKVVDKDETHWEARMRRMAERKAEKKKKRKERIQAGEDANTEEAAATFDDPFFTDERSDAKRAARAAKKRKRSAVAGTERVEYEAEKRKRVTQLELLMADDGPKVGGVRKKLADAASDDEGDDVPKKKKKTRGRRRADKERVEIRKKVSAFDASDDRFNGLFDSHQFALDPTHPKFKMDGTTELIRAERQKRSRRDGDAPSRTSRVVQKQPSAADDRKPDVLGLAEKIKAKARGARVL